ncbi:hypothetical protein EJB05_54285, partial [Eragrostis curvula]
MSPPHSFLLLSVLALLFPPLLLASSSFPLPTIAIAAVRTNASPSPHHIACALVPTVGAQYELSCASITNRSAPPHNYSYGGGGGTTPFSAVVAGDGYLCSAASVGPTPYRQMSMRWWDLNHRAAPSKRVYSGAALSAVSGGGEYVCGLVEGRIQCWRWAGGAVGEDLVFSAVAVGGGFVCGLVNGTGEVRCYGDGGAVVGREPKGRHALVAAGERHACAVKEKSGEVVCWGEAAAVAAAAPSMKIAGRAVSSVAVGDAVTCVLWGNWTVSCWPEATAAPPPEVARKQFVALDAKGKAVCGVLMSDYSLVCWGAIGGGAASSKVFDRVLPGPCAPWEMCKCGVWSGSAPLCGGDAAVCYPCGYTPPPMALLPTSNSSSPASGDDHPTGGRRRMSDLAIALVSAGIGSGLMAAFAAVLVVYCLRRGRGGGAGGAHDSGRRIHAEPPLAPLPRVERRLSSLLSKAPTTTADRVHRVLDARLPLPTPGEMEAVAYVGYLASDCVRPAGRDRPTMSEVVSVLERAVAACEEHEDDQAVLSRSCTDGSTTT